MPRKRIRVVDDGSSGRKRSKSPRRTKDKALREGDKIEANYKSKGKNVPVTCSFPVPFISSLLLCVLFVVEKLVAVFCWRFFLDDVNVCLLTTISSLPVLLFHLNRWYKGTIDRVNSDGSYHVTYDDGDKERFLLAKNVRRRPGSGGGGGAGSDTASDSDGQEPLERGDKVEACPPASFLRIGLLRIAPCPTHASVSRTICLLSQMRAHTRICAWNDRSSIVCVQPIVGRRDPHVSVFAAMIAHTNAPLLNSI